jgi:hypothetical protein
MQDAEQVLGGDLSSGLAKLAMLGRSSTEDTGSITLEFGESWRLDTLEHHKMAPLWFRWLKPREGLRSAKK